MTEESRQELLDLFRAWVLEQTSPDYSLYIKENDPSTIVLETERGRAEVTFFAQEIIQLSVLDFKTDSHVFYLHFQIHSLEHACTLFEEMRDTLLELAAKPSARILLSCASGLTTSFFAKKLNESAQLLSLDYDFHAEPYSELYKVGNEYDIILIAPQIYYAYDDIKKILPDKTVLKIPAKVFASYDVQGLLDEITPYINGEAEEEKASVEDISAPPASISIRRDVHIEVAVLAIALINDEQRYQYAYRVYDEGSHILYNSDVLKPKLDIYDLIDICDTALALFPEIKVIGLAMPGIIDEGRVSLINQGLDNTDIVKILTERFNRKVVLENDANSIAIGYYASQDKYSSLSVLFQPFIGNCGGVGSINNGQLITGIKHVAGEVQYLPFYRHTDTGDGDDTHDPDEQWKTPEGALELATEIMASIIAILGPELMVLSSHLLFNVDTITSKLEEYIPKQYIPDIVVLLNNIREYMLLGVIIVCAGETDRSAAGENGSSVDGKE